MSEVRKRDDDRKDQITKAEREDLLRVARMRERVPSARSWKSARAYWLISIISSTRLTFSILTRSGNSHGRSFSKQPRTPTS
jgi:hypothetical protein